jgi:hypothetical protein
MFHVVDLLATPQQQPQNHDAREQPSGARLSPQYVQRPYMAGERDPADHKYAYGRGS